MRSDFVFLEVEGQRLDIWTSYKAESDLLTPSDAFSFELGIGASASADRARDFARYRELLAKGASVKLYVGDDVTGRNRSRYLQLTGHIESREVDQSVARGTTIRVSGYDLARPLVRSHVPVSLVRTEGTSFIALVRAAVEPWGIDVITDVNASRDILTGRVGTSSEDELLVEQARAQGISPSAMRRSLVRRAQRAKQPLDETLGVTASQRSRDRAANGMAPSDLERLTLRDARPRPGETVWEFLERHARRLGILMWMSPRGQLVLGAPRYTQEPLYRFVRRFANDPQDPNTILEGSVSESMGEQVSRVTVYGRTGGSDVERARVRATAEDDSAPMPIEVVVHDNDLRTQDEATRHAKRVLAEAQNSGLSVEYQLPDHGLGRYLYGIDTMAQVIDEVGGINEAMYVTGRSFSRSREHGTTTTVRLARRGSIAL